MPVAAYLPRVIALVTHLHRPAAPSRMAQLIEQVSADYRQQARIEVIETSLADLLPLARELESRQQADVILCSGAAADYLRQHLSTTVRTLHLGEFDLIRALVLARDRASRVGILSFGQPYPELAAMQALFTLQIREHTYTSLEQARAQVEGLVEDGFEVIIGSPTVCQLADAAGAQGVLALDAESLRHTFDSLMTLGARLDEAPARRMPRRLREQPAARQFNARHRFEQMLGDAPAFRATLRLAQRYAQTDATVLITGESGTGKELLAQSLHNASPRQQAPFVAINCAALPESLLESELFGYEDGAFTGSRKGGKPGLIELAHTGTLFLDEIGDMPVALQTRLLRVLQEREVLRLGACEPTAVDIRVIAATHCDLTARIAEQRFRQDLFYRLNTLRLAVPPLRERVEDILPLFNALLARHSRASGMPLAGPEHVQPLLPLLLRHPWPGNIRELDNIAERAALCLNTLGDDDGVALYTLFPELLHTVRIEDLPPAPTDNLRSLGKAAEAAHARQVLERCDGDMDEAARRLGVSRSTVWRRVRG
ncbi:propionate catabolism operon regulatory protein PrpR [Pseudomonas sp. KU43P]|uniref:propionate catabolism operon regulatory protein PrpR n=1 Tax=Pseudomonas sp. KU43P TaxID=2487887 RepID=UPI0012AA65E3|nr:propionate catabolism operon regulatory protein PrpR [Pseudomonas sp. KU43P]BBH45707.1 propionate catabolism operon regulatory protein PrpR [Pseudomonas sp. KU43P]